MNLAAEVWGWAAAVSDGVLGERAGRNIKQMVVADDGHHQICVSQQVTRVTPFKQ